MSASESGATITQSTGEPRPDGWVVGRNGAARRGSGAARGTLGGSWARAAVARAKIRQAASGAPSLIGPTSRRHTADRREPSLIRGLSP